MWDQDKQQMEQESSKTSFALIRLTLDYINMRNLGITVRVSDVLLQMQTKFLHGS